MNNRFKFRVWDPTNKTMLYYHEINLAYRTDGRPNEYIHPEIYAWENIDINKKEGIKKLNGKELDKCVYQQCIGMKDCGGTDIYEGDAVEIKNGEEVCTGIVHYDQDTASYCILYEGESGFSKNNNIPIHHSLNSLHNDITIIGHCYELKTKIRRIKTIHNRCIKRLQEIRNEILKNKYSRFDNRLC